MWILIVLWIAAFISAAARQLLKKRRQRQFVGLRWSNTVFVNLSPADALAAVSELMQGEHGCRFFSKESGCHVFTRGDQAIREVPSDLDVAWADIPLVIVVGCEAASAETCIGVSFQPRRTVRFSEEASQEFRQLAESEFRAIVNRLEACAGKRGESRRTEECANDENAYAVLHLKPGATWAVVQAAYRNACKQYHPDTLAGQNLPSHLVELAIKQFKEISAAYQTLKSRLCG